MNRKTVLALAVLASIGSMPAATMAQGVERSEAIAASDVLSQISMYSYRERRKSDLSGVVASYPRLTFVVAGHTDNVGGSAMNNELSLRRAIAVRDYLITQRVAASAIDVVGLGFSMPVGENSTPDGRARNRRVEIVISGGPK